MLSLTQPQPQLRRYAYNQISPNNISIRRVKSRGVITQLFFKIQQKFPQFDQRLAYVITNFLKFWILFIHIFMHVEAAVSLNLQRKDVFSGLAVVKSNKTSGIRAVKLYPVAIFFKALRQTGREFGRTAFIEQGTETEVNRLAFVHDSADLGRHGMAVHQQAKAEFFIAAVNQLFEPFMVNVVNIFNPFLDFIIRNQPGIDIFGLGNRPVDNAQPDPGSGGCRFRPAAPDD